MRRRILAASALALAIAAGHRVEGRSFFLGESVAEYFLSMPRCEREAAATHSDGSWRYAGYRCVRKWLVFTLGKKREVLSFYRAALK